MDEDECNVLTANCMRHSSLSTSYVGDVVLIRKSRGVLGACQIWIHADCHGVLMSVVQMLHFVSRDASRSISTWRKVDQYECIPVEDIIDPAIWNEYDRDLVRIILPIDIDERL